MAETITPRRAHMLIDGERVASADGRTFHTTNPATGELLAEVALAGVEDVNRAVAAARRAFDDGPWPRWSARRRAQALFTVAQLIRERRDTLAELETRASGPSGRGQGRVYGVHGGGPRHHASRSRAHHARLAGAWGQVPLHHLRRCRSGARRRPRALQRLRQRRPGLLCADAYLRAARRARRVHRALCRPHARVARRRSTGAGDRDWLDGLRQPEAARARLCADRRRGGRPRADWRAATPRPPALRPPL